MKVHCVYIPDVILSICRMSLLLTKTNESALCLYAGCLFVYMPDAIFALNINVKVHCVYIPDVILSICWMSFWLARGSESALCLHAGCHSVYMPDVTFDFKTRVA